ncbi:MAG: inositol monophosphatase [Clostridium sp.]|nr:inositol monophosphatase [Clostridium sp.]
MKVNASKIIPLVKTVKPLFLDKKRAAQVKVKGVADFVTQVDFQVQEMMRRGLKELYPRVQFMGEEKDNRDIDFDGPVWILDPVDGTTNLIHDYRNSALSLAFCDRGELKLGIIYQPYTEELFLGIRGEGASVNGVPIHVSGVAAMEQSLIAVGTSPYDRSLAHRNFDDFKRVFLRCSDIRRNGSAAIELAHVACGRTDAYFERNLKPWDFAAGILIVEEAGGSVTNYRGERVEIFGNSQIIASNGRIGGFLREMLQE